MFDPDILLTESRRAAASSGHDYGDRTLCDHIRALELARAAIDAAQIELLAELDTRDLTNLSAGLKTGTWLAREAHCSTKAGRARVRTATKLRAFLPNVCLALAAGELSWDHATVFSRVLRSRIADLIIALETELIELAHGMVFERWKDEVLGLADLLDQDGGHDPNHDHANNHLTLATTIDGLTLLNATFTDANGAILNELLTTKADELFQRFTRDAKHNPELTVPSRGTILSLALLELVRAGAAINLTDTRPTTEATLLIPAGHPHPHHPDTTPTDTCTCPHTGADDPGGTDGPDDTDDTDPAGDPGAASDPGRTHERPNPGATNTDPVNNPEPPGDATRPRGRIEPPPGRRQAPDPNPGPNPDPDPGPGPELDLADLLPRAWLDRYGLGPRSRLGHLLARTAPVTTTHGLRLTNDTYRLLTCDCTTHALLVDDHGLPLQLGTGQRLANAAQRKAIEQRDGGCTYPDCPMPFSWCDIHHITPWTPTRPGDPPGPTDIDNLIALCRYHHSVIHRTGWTMTPATHPHDPTDTGWFTITAPNGTTTPSQRHGRQPTPPPDTS